MTEKTFFGYKQVNKNDKEKLVSNVFSSVAKNYDIMNDAMSLGIHRLWKNQLINSLHAQENSHLLDVAGGTGDIAFRFMKKHAQAKVTICDINKEMLTCGRDNALDNNIFYNINFICANAEKLPFPDNYFDFYTIAFGIRNVTNIDKALNEAYRVLKIGGKFACLEFSHVENKCFSSLYDLYSFKIIPKIGRYIANDKEAYSYLVESIRKFPKQEEFMDMIAKSGFKKLQFRNMTGGVVAIHSGWKW